MTQQLEQVKLKLGESVAVHVYGVGWLCIELSEEGRSFISGPLLEPGRTVLEFAKTYGIFGSDERERAKAMKD